MNSTTPLGRGYRRSFFPVQGSFPRSRVPGLFAGRSLDVLLITLAEIEYGMYTKNWGARRRELMGRFLARFRARPPRHLDGPRVGADKAWLREEGPANFICGCLDFSDGRAVEYFRRYSQWQRLRNLGEPVDSHGLGAILKDLPAAPIRSWRGPATSHCGSRSKRDSSAMRESCST